MEITRNNFKETLPIVAQAIEDCTFLSLDTEFSGLTNGTVSVTNFDSPEDRYQKIRSNTGSFTILQFGLCTFKLDEKTSKYSAKAFNFYIFPFRSNCPGVPDRIFSCQSSSIDFLSAQNFDFNKVFREGIPYLKPPEEALCRSSLEERHMQRTSPRKSLDPNINGASPCSSPTPISDQRTKDFVDSVCKKIEDFLQDSNGGEVLKLDPCNSYLRKILYETIPKRFNDSVFLESRTDEKRHRYLVVVRACGEDALKKKQDEAKARDNALLEDAIGFSKVMQLITGSQKLILGHNCLFDIVYSVQQFISNLPPTLDEFKALVRCVFPRVIDTKLMGSMLPFKENVPSTALGDMYARLQTEPFGLPEIDLPQEYSSVVSDNYLHEAGYDAFITGASFLGMLKFLHKIGKSKSTVTLKNDYISPYCNKLFLMRSPDIPYLNLSGADLSPTRSHVFHVNFPAAWKTNDIRQMFGSVTGGVQISWINDTQCFVGLYNKSQVGLVRKIITQNQCGNAVIKSYDDYQKELSAPPQHFNNNNSRPFSQNKVWLSTNSAPKRSYSSAVSHNLQPSASTSNPLAKKFSPAKNITETTSTSTEKVTEDADDELHELREVNSNTEVKSKVTSDRKRHGNETESSNGNGEVDEPKIKRQRSQECLNKDGVKQGVAATAMAIGGTSKATNGFEVPETW